MVYGSLSLGYEELKNVLREVCRKRKRWHSGRAIHKKLLEACVAFTRSGLRIADKMVLDRLRVALVELRVLNRRLGILLNGETRASEMWLLCKAHGVFKWAPRLKEWLQEEGYRFWLGMICLSLDSCTIPVFRTGSNQMLSEKRL